jgi:hypothetical protein
MLRCVLSIALLAFASVASAQTPFPARFVLAGQTVVVPKGEYLLTQECVVRTGGTLVLDAGVVVKVRGLGVPFQIYGTLQANGSASNPVVVSADSLSTCGTLAAYWTAGTPRPKVEANYFDYTCTKNSNALFLSACDFVLTNTKIASKATTAANRVCVAAVNGSAGVVSGCFLDGCNDTTAKPSVGLSIGNGNNQGDVVELLETLISNTTDPVKIKKQFALVSGLIE